MEVLSLQLLDITSQPTSLTTLSLLEKQLVMFYTPKITKSYAELRQEM